MTIFEVTELTGNLGSQQWRSWGKLQEQGLWDMKLEMTHSMTLFYV